MSTLAALLHAVLGSARRRSIIVLLAGFALFALTTAASASLIDRLVERRASSSVNAAGVHYVYDALLASTTVPANARADTFVATPRSTLARQASPSSFAGNLAAKGVTAGRNAYQAEVAGLEEIEVGMRMGGASAEQIARALHAERRAIGVRYKDLTPQPLRDQIYARNLEKYGDRLGPSIDYLRSRGKSWDDIVGSAQRTGGKDLGF